MKKITWLFILLVLPLPTAYAEKMSDVSLRFSNHGGNIRIVVQSDDEFIENTSVQLSSSIITAAFPSRFALKIQKDFPFGIRELERSLVITMKNYSDIRTYKLKDPARLVIDLRISAKSGELPSGERDTTAPQQAQGTGIKTPDAERPLGRGVPEAGPQVSPKNPSETALQTGRNAPLEPAENPRRNVVVIDPGHGGYDYGLITPQAKEKDMDLSLAKDLLNALSKKGMTAFVTRKADQNSSLSDRINFSIGKGPFLFLSIHASSSDKFIVYIATVDEGNMDAVVRQYSQFSNQNKYLERSRVMARLIGRSLGAEFGADVVLRELPLPILTTMNAPAVLIECPLLGTFASDRRVREKFVNSVFKGISAYVQ